MRFALWLVLVLVGLMALRFVLEFAGRLYVAVLDEWQRRRDERAKAKHLVLVLASAVQAAGEWAAVL